ncbi:MAG: hypothetical protein HRT87_10505, partial [Legionellales bacterium]|nr:hypothetical protein [Legionellales bacterium]
MFICNAFNFVLIISILTRRLSNKGNSLEKKASEDRKKNSKQRKADETAAAELIAALIRDEVTLK